jgi:hypothetical protein
MPSLVVHYAFVGLLAATVLGAAFDKRSLALSLVVVTVPDIDAFIGLVSSVGHRAATTNLVIPALAGALIAVDLHAREESAIRRRWGAYGVRVAWFCVVVYAVGHVFMDMITGGANLFWPLHDQFYQVSGRLELSSQRGIVQTFLDLDGSGPTFDAMGDTSEVQMSTGVDPNPGGDGTSDQPVDRVFPIVRSGWQLFLLVFGTLGTATRFVIGYDLPDESR